MSRKLTLDDISDTRAYERERDEFRAQVMALKARRRIPLGPLVTVMFENRETMRLQVQEMVRVERITTDEGVQEELDAYNPLIPEPGQLRATVFVELTSDEQMREWLPKLVGIERSILLRLADGREVRAATEAQHESQLTREEVTAAVHYIELDLTAAEVEGFRSGPVVLAVDHPEYQAAAELGHETVEELLADLLP